MFTEPPMWEWTPKPNDYTTPLPAIAMANNRLFIRNRKTGEYTGFLKSFGEGWEIRKTAEQIEKDVAALFDDASFGNCFGATTDLELVAENDPRYQEIDGLLVYSPSHSA
jgi:hypothetical protein